MYRKVLLRKGVEKTPININLSGRLIHAPKIKKKPAYCNNRLSLTKQKCI
nr:MAG TPA: hypothetical protein [Caudoviricetes sp.]